MLTWSTAGESHGASLIAIMEGMPAGVPITTALLQDALAERRGGYGRGARQKFEEDKVRILSGVRHGHTTGAPITVQIENSEWPKWQVVMSPDPVEPAELEIDAGRGDRRELARNHPLKTPRPGHADLPGLISYGLSDARDVLERASARETAARVALGALARAFLRTVSDIEVVAHVVAVGPADHRSTYEEAGKMGAESGEKTEQRERIPRPEDRMRLQESALRTLDPEAEADFIAVIDQARAQGDTVGGIVEVAAWGVPVGLGTHVSEAGKLDARLAASLMAIQSVKAVEVGGGFETARLFGSAAHDSIKWRGTDDVARTSNRAGGIEGGTSNGEPIVLTAAFKPIATLPRGQRTIDLGSGGSSTAFHQRSDTCQVVPGAVIVEAQVCLQLALAVSERFGGHSVEEVQAGIQWQNQNMRRLLQARS